MKFTTTEDLNLSTTLMKTIIFHFWNHFATNLPWDMDPAEDIKKDVLLANIKELMKNNFYNKKLEESIKHKIESSIKVRSL